MATKSVSKTVERRIKRHPGRLFTYADFDDLPVSAVAPALSRLCARGEIRRARKGVYYAPRDSVLGEVPADPLAVAKVASEGKATYAGLTGANVLGLTTQVPALTELAVEGKRADAPQGVVFKPRSGTNRLRLKPDEAALLEVLRDLGHLTDLTPSDTATKLTALLADDEARYRVLRASTRGEPPRVRAMVAALAEAAGADESELRNLRKTLNPITTYNFGPLAVLPTARAWGAR